LSSIFASQLIVRRRAKNIETLNWNFYIHRGKKKKFTSQKQSGNLRSAPAKFYYTKAFESVSWKG
jgi:hypothetical protein